MKKTWYYLLALVATVMMSCSGGSSDIPEPGPGPTPGPGPDIKEISYTLESNTVFVDPKVANEIQSADTLQHILHISGAVSADKVPQPGTQIIVNTPTEALPYGLLARVINVQQQGGEYLVKYEECELTDVFEKLQIPETPLNLDGKLQYILDENGNVVQDFTQGTRAKDDQMEWGYAENTITFPDHEWDLPLGLSLTPHISALLQMRFLASLLDNEVKYLRVQTDVEMTLGADLNLSHDALSVELISVRKLMGTLIYAAVPVGPLIINPSVDLYALVNVDGKISLEASITYRKCLREVDIYQAGQGMMIDLETYDADRDPGLKMNIAPKIEGNAAWGFGLGHSFNIYGKLLTVGASLDVQFKESFSKKFILAEYDNGKTDYLKWDDTNFSTSYETSVHGYVEVATHEVAHADAFKLSWPVESFKMMPELAENFDIIRDEENNTVTVEAWVKNKHLLECSIWGVLKYSSDDEDKDSVFVHFDYDDEKAALMNNDGDSVKITAVATDLDHTEYYVCDMWMTVERIKDVHMGTLEKLTYNEDDENTSAMRMILFDIMKCADGEWKGCNWDKPGIPFIKMENVEASMKNGKPLYEVYIPQEWKVKPGTKLSVGNYSKGLSEFGAWELYFDHENITAVDIQDEHCSVIGVNDKVTDFSFHSLIWDMTSNIPNQVKNLDLSGSGVTNLRLSTKFECLPTSVKLDDCKQLTDLYFGDEDEKVADMPTYSVKGCDKLSNIYINKRNIPAGMLDKEEAGMPNAHLRLFGSTLKDLAPAQNFRSISMTSCTFDRINLSGNANIGSLFAYTSQGKDITVNNCAKIIDIQVSNSCTVPSLSVSGCTTLSTLRCEGSGLTSLQLSNLPALIDLRCQNNHGLMAKVPAVFDEVRQKEDHTLLYDQRYTYTYNASTQKTESKDNGYGFWYDGEPERGYHIEGEEHEEIPGEVLPRNISRVQIHTTGKTQWNHVADDNYPHNPEIDGHKEYSGQGNGLGVYKEHFDDNEITVTQSNGLTHVEAFSKRNRFIATADSKDSNCKISFDIVTDANSGEMMITNLDYSYNYKYGRTIDPSDVWWELEECELTANNIPLDKNKEIEIVDGKKTVYFSAINAISNYVHKNTKDGSGYVGTYFLFSSHSVRIYTLLEGVDHELIIEITGDE